MKAAALIAGAALLVGAAPAQAAAPRGKTVRIYDNYFLKDDITVKRGAIVTWRWPGFDEAGDVHDVKLKSAPDGVRKWQSEPASSGYRFKRTLRTPGRYRIICTLHEEMTMTIRVRR